MNTTDFPEVILRGAGQVMLQNNALTGLLFLAGIFYNSWIMGIGAIIGVLASTLAAIILHYDDADIEKGLYGFNGALVGVALLFFFKAGLILLCLLVLAAIISSLIMKFMHKRNLYPYTFPFVLSAWIIIAIIKVTSIVPAQAHESALETTLNIFSSLSMGFGQVMFQASIITGVIFFIAILVNSRLSAIYAFFGSFVGMLAAYLLSFPVNWINVGIFGFNGVLCGVAFAGRKKESVIYAAVSIILSVFIMYGMAALDFVALTSPFVFAAWITVGINKLMSRKPKQKP